jgi:hypothetical protein
VIHVALDPLEHELAFVDAFVDPAKKGRYRALLPNRKRRRSILDRLAHAPGLDVR